MHIASQWALEHFPVEAPSMQSEAVASLSRGSHETSGSGIFSLPYLLFPLYTMRKPDGTLLVLMHSKKISFSALVKAKLE
jgi:hypothetical protein